jgi:hypothetical protein
MFVRRSAETHRNYCFGFLFQQPQALALIENWPAGGSMSAIGIYRQLTNIPETNHLRHSLLTPDSKNLPMHSGQNPFGWLSVHTELIRVDK